MDRECVSVLPRVCEVLAAAGSSLPDDTSLEKLLDWFTALTKAGISLLEACPCLLEFISTVVSNNTTSDPSILSFALKLTGLLATTEHGFKVLQECSVLDLVFDCHRWQEAGLWEDPSIKIGWIQGLRTMLQHPKALYFFLQADLTEPLLQLQTDTSLFVASAANQMLAHVLLFCQSISPPVRCHDTDQETYSNHLTVPMETQQKHSAVAVEVCEYLKKSLVPKGTSQLHQSQQVLKLLALLLTRAGPPLRDKLLLTVLDSLEELVTTNYSQLTLPLMDAILAAPRCRGDEHISDKRVTRLLFSMLNTRNPADLIHAAAALLHSSHPDQDLIARSAGILLLPLDIITGLPLLGTNDTVAQHRLSMTEQLKSKTSCVSMICVSLTNVPQATHCLPCTPHKIVSAVLYLLRLCRGDSSSSPSGCAEVFRNVTGNGRVQKCALDALVALSSSSGTKVMLVEVFTLLIQYLNNPASDPAVIQKSYQVVKKWISVCSDLSDITVQLRKDLLQVVRKRVCDPRWEVRDSTVEFLGHLVEEEACETSELLLGGRCISIPLLQEALQDPESYVRASSVSALARTLAPSWQQGAALTPEEAEIVTRLLKVLSEDTEVFSRRAVVQFFIAWFSSCPSPSSCSLLTLSVPSVLSQGSADLDWEVKVHTLELAELLMNRATESHLHPNAGTSNPTDELHSHTETHTDTHTAESEPLTMLNSLVDRGVFSALLSGLVDCDRPVGLKACQLLIRLRDTVCPLLLGDQDVRDALVTDSRASCELPGSGWAREVRRMLGTTTTAPSSINGVDGLSSEDRSEEEEDHTVRVGVCDVLRRLRLDERLAILTQSSDHVHNSPLSLLQDILTASRTNASLDSQLGQEVIVDCY